MKCYQAQVSVENVGTYFALKLTSFNLIAAVIGYVPCTNSNEWYVSPSVIKCSKEYRLHGFAPDPKDCSKFYRLDIKS
jgi:hypothetical protein